MANSPQTVEALTNQGVMVFLNNHVSSAGWCCSNGDGEGLWWTRKYNERLRRHTTLIQQIYALHNKTLRINLRKTNKYKLIRGLVVEEQ